MKEFYRQGKERYFAQWWNFVTILMLVFFFLAGIFWLLGSSALLVNEHDNSLKYIVKSITRDSAFNFLLLSNTFSAGIRKLFWALFDKTDLEAFEIDSNTFSITQATGETLFAIFEIAAILISLNMLIAMMTNSFQQIADDSDIQWKFSRTGMWMQFVDKGSVVPPPFNLLPSRKYFVEFCQRCCDWIKSKKREHYDDLDSSDVEPAEEDDDMVEREKILKLLIDRYFFSSRQARDRLLLNNALKAFGINNQDASKAATDTTDDTDSSPIPEEQKPKNVRMVESLATKIMLGIFSTIAKLLNN
ncbi:hypothetical protein OS493_026362 [Desmophyllum pertusum]|uniref:Ion transport domain-containing protein n=1 Tax=Desmophyllum pertusum TaxID=174260 RepID=A0A9W9ZAE6_9CNID|nr:hypothetical protein OS493_026362 [Desmophyllum pertusum]